ncbi:hypothetical protein [Microbulbifer sp. ALW1]|uniref:hypothetical protein n=1 Tax=Microbulbifer sp. (strain ALW1) TaxID=1516059 RepID=UPI00135A4DFF|nr:hypothetical protein [Microbulbifer sp. ALW1]
MAELQRLEKLLKAALDAGDMDDANFFRRELVTHPDYAQHRKAKLNQIDEQLNPEAGTYLRDNAPMLQKPVGAVRSGLQGLTFGLSDEIAAGITAPFVDESYSDIQKGFDQEQRQFAEKNPVLSTTAELAGGLATGGAGLAKSGATMAGRSPLARALAATATGAAEGGVYGAGTSQQGERLQGGLEGAAFGAAAAPVAGVAGKVAGKAGVPALEWINKNLLASPQRNAEKFLARGLATEGTKQGMLARALREMGPNAVLADVSTSARNSLEGVIQKGDNPNIANQAEALLLKRNAGQQPRLIGDLTENLGIPENVSIQQTVDKLGKQRSNTAGPLYQQAYQQPLQRTEKLDSLMRAPAVQSALKSAETIAANQRIAGDQISHMRLFDLAKQDLDDQIGRALNSGEKGRARDLIRLKQDLVSELDEQVPVYKEARDIFANHSAMIDAAEMGRRILREDADYMDEVLKGMGNAEKEMFRIGAGRAIRDKLMQASTSGDATKRLNSGLIRERMQRAFPDKESFDQFMKKVEVESNIYSTTNILANSATARRLAEFKRQEGVDLPGIEGGATGVAIGLFKRLMGAGLDDEAKEELARLTMQRLGDVDLDALNKAINKSTLRDSQKEWLRTRLPEFAAVTAAPSANILHNALSENPTASRQQMMADALRGNRQ